MSMASREKPADPRRPAPRLYLVAPQEPAGLAERLAHAAEDGRVDLGDLGRRARKLVESSTRPGEGQQLF